MIQTLIDETLKKDSERERPSSGKISPSSLGWCYRRHIYKLTNIPQTNPPDARTLRLFKAGTLFHDFVQQFIPTHQTEVLAETPEIKGYADIVTEDTVVEIKSVHSESFWYTKKDNYDVKKEKYSNWLQLACYGIILKKPKLLLVLVSKDDLCIDEYGDFTEKWEEEVRREIDKILLCSSSLPPPEPRLYNGKECQYCSWRDKCKSTNLKEIIRSLILV